MSELLRAKELIEQNRYEEALEIFQNLSHQEQLSFEEREVAFIHQIEICKTLSKANENLKVLREYFDFLWAQKKFENALPIIESIVQNETQAKFSDVYHLWFCLCHCGEIERATRLGEKYLEALYQKKNFQHGLNFSKEFEEKIGQQEMTIYYQLAFYVLRGDKNSIEKVVGQNKELLLSKSKNLYLKKAKQLVLKLKDFETYPKVSKVSFELSLNLLEASPADELVFYGKDLIHRLFDYLLFCDLDAELFHILIRYSCKVKSRIIIEGLIRLADVQPQLLRGQRKLSKIFEDAKVERASWTEVQSDNNSEEYFDLGEDLLAGPAVTNNTVVIRRLEHDIAILKKKNLIDEAKIILSKLKELDPTHPLVTREERKKNSEEKQIHLRELINQDIKNQSDQLAEDKVMMTSFKKYLDYLDRETLKENFRDITVSLLNFNAPELAIPLLKELQNEFISEDQIEKKLSLQYLLVTCLESADKNFDAMIVLDEVLNLDPLLDEERKVFLYLKGEIAKKIGQMQVALNSYRAVKQIDPTYRLVSERINELAKS